MAKIVQLDGPATDFAQRAFRRYYEAARVEPPEALAEREFAAFPFGGAGGMRRHAALPTPELFRAFLREVAPRHVYYSSAYYDVPDDASMAAKGWRGADVIFDIDADHLRGAEGLGYVDQLGLAKEQVRRLYDEFLVGDFGLEPSNLRLVFSGGRGYHIHVRDERLRGLTSPERRELVDYIQGGDLDAGAAIVEEAHAEGGERLKHFGRLSPPGAAGWPGRTTRALLALLERWEREGRATAEAELVRAGLSATDAHALARKLVDRGAGERMRSTGRLDVLRRPIPVDLLKVVLKAATITVQGETDAPVTTDIHRLIRLPGSLHGGTGFRVTPLTREQLDGFDPIASASYPFGRSDRVEVELAERVDYRFEEAVAGARGDRRLVTTPVALFLLLRGEAGLPPSAG